MNNDELKVSENITGANLKRIRESSGISAEKLGNLTKADLNLTVEDIMAIEAKKHVVYDYELVCFSKLFNVKIDEFFD